MSEQKTRRPIAAFALAVAASLAFIGCSQDASDADLDEPTFKGDARPDDFSAQAPDSVRIYQNVDDHPTIVRVCIDGLAFMTISTSHSGLASPAVQRIAEWDDQCPAD